MKTTPCVVLVALLLNLHVAFAAQANVSVGARFELVRFEPVDEIDFPEIPNPQIALWRSVHQAVLPLELSKTARLASARDLYALLSDDGLRGLQAEWQRREHSALARQTQLTKRGAIVVGGGFFSLSFMMFTGVLLWRNEKVFHVAPKYFVASKRLAETRRQILQEALGHLLALRDCMLVATAPNGELTACRLIKRPRLKFASSQVAETAAWMRSVRGAGQSLEFASVKSESDLERFIYWARCLRDADAAALGLRDLRNSALELDAAMREATAPPQVVVMPVYEFNTPALANAALRLAS